MTVVAGMDLSTADLEVAMERTRAAWLQSHPDADEDEAPAVLRRAGAPRKERSMERMTPEERFWFETLRGTRALTEPRRFGTGDRTITVSPIDASTARSLAREIETLASRDATVRGLPMPIRAAERLEPARPPAPRVASDSTRKEPTMVKTKDDVWTEIQRDAASFAGDYPTPEQRVAAFMTANPRRYHEYNSAPWPEPTVPKPPPPLTFAEAERAYRANPRSQDAVWELIEAKARQLTEKDAKLTKEQAVVEVLHREPELYSAYLRGA